MQFGECLSFISCNFLHQLRNVTLKFLAAPINSSLWSLTNCKMFSTNFPTDSNRSMTDSTKGRKILFCSSSLEYPQKILRSTVHWLFPVRPSGMNGRGDFKSAGVGTGKFVGCVCRRCYIHFISEPPEGRMGKGLFFYLFMDCLFLTNSKMSFYVIFLLFSSSIFKI